MKPNVPTRGGGPQGLSEGAKVILRHFRDTGAEQLAYEYPATIAALFSDPQQCEDALEELYSEGLIELGAELPRHIPVSNRVRAAAITLEGLRLIERGDLDL